MEQERPEARKELCAKGENMGAKRESSIVGSTRNLLNDRGVPVKMS